MRLYLRGDVYWVALPGGRRKSTRQRVQAKALAVAESWTSNHPARQVIRWPNRPGTIYFIEAVGAERIKIGWTEMPIERRMRELQTACPFPLTARLLLAGTQAEERALHRRFAHCRAMPNTEWFHLIGEIISFMK